MKQEIAYLHDEADHQRKVNEIKQTIQAYVQGNPETPTFRFFLPSTQDIEAIKQAVARASLSTGKPIDLIYPTSITQEVQEP
ncbi:MAG: hypothetical protein H0V70_01765 [Ktedonobacteraceae bacterium]|nr:hypothetical protein [Ktedonobacteraceae bacterium]